LSHRYSFPVVTPRLILRPLEPADAASLYEAKKETAASLSKVFEWAAHGFDPEKDRAYATKSAADYAAGTDLSLVGIDRESGRPVIYTGLHDKEGEKDTYQIGFWVRQSEQGRRLAQESTNALIRYAFNALGARKIVMCHSEGNVKSRAIFERLGFDYDELRAKSLTMAGGKIVDAHWYRMTSPDRLPPLDVRWQVSPPPASCPSHL
jgi:RimJ/RimL family protein N-acetyltransferase